MLPDLVVRSLWRTKSKQKGSQVTAIDDTNGLQDRFKGNAEIVNPSPRQKSDLEELNASLATLTAIFPDVRADVFRELLESFSRESRLQLVTESLLKQKADLVRGRWKVARDFEGNLDTNAAVDPAQCLRAEEMFRSAGYRDAVKQAFYQEFKAISHSHIKSVLAEHNYSYTLCRPILINSSSKSWRASLASFIWRRKTASSVENPLILWTKGPGESLEPKLIPTPSDELNEELETSLILPLKREIKEKQLSLDKTIANDINQAEAEAVDSMFDCECCFTPNTFENIATCSDGEHFVCLQCIRYTLREALYGQGWGRSVDQQKCTVRCIAVDDGSSGECKSCIPRKSVQMALTDDKNGDDIWRKFEERLAGENLASTDINTAKCPFCVYAEIIDTQESKEDTKTWWLALLPATALAVSCVSIQIMFSLPLPTFLVVLALTISLYAHVSSLLPFAHPAVISPTSTSTATSIMEHPTTNGRKFLCRNIACQRLSCLSCLQLWNDPHTCDTDAPSTTSLSTPHRLSPSQRRARFRTHLDAALTAAVKRTCPRCRLSFVKATGCNKLLCPCCGCATCYVCRAEIGPRARAGEAAGQGQGQVQGQRQGQGQAHHAGEGYAHFCPHFRPEPGERCRECSRCDLYRVEDEAEVLRAARARAVAEWREMEKEEGVEPLELRGLLDDFGVGGGDGEDGSGKGKGRWRLW